MAANTNDYIPSNSTNASLGYGTALSIIIAWIASQLGLKMSMEVAMSFGAIVSAVVGYFFKGGKAVHTEPEILPIPVVPVIKLPEVKS